MEVRTSTSVWIPVWLFIPDRVDKNLATVLAIDAAGRNADSHEDGLYDQLARGGRVVCAADVRGIGDTRPEVGRGNPGYTIEHDAEDAFAWASLILGESLLAQRIEDILALAQALRNHPSVQGTKLVMAARGRLTVPALFAFAASPLADSLYLAGGLDCYRSVLETEQYRQPLSNFAFDIARITDLPRLAAQAAPRSIRLAGNGQCRWKTHGYFFGEGDLFYGECHRFGRACLGYWSSGIVVVGDQCGTLSIGAGRAFRPPLRI